MPDRPPGRRKRTAPGTDSQGRTRKHSDLAAEAGNSLTPSRGDPWYHRLPCHHCGVCGVCGANGCWVYNPGGLVTEVHICWRGCDGLPRAVLELAA